MVKDQNLSLHFKEVHLLTPSSLIKMLYWMCEKSKQGLTWPQLQHAIYRNFGGMESDELDPLKVFKKWIPIPIKGCVPDLQSISHEVQHITTLSISVMM